VVQETLKLSSVDYIHRHQINCLSVSATLHFFLHMPGMLV